MFQRRRPLRTAPRTRSLALGGALAALAVVGGATVVATTGPTDVTTQDIRLTQNAPAHQMQLGVPVDLDLEPVVARAAGGTVPDSTTVQVTGLPDGLVQNGWVISGTPTREGEYDVLITVSDSGQSRSERVTIAVTDDPAGAGGQAAGTGEPANGTAQGDDTPGGDTPGGDTPEGETRLGETSDNEAPDDETLRDGASDGETTGPGGATTPAEAESTLSAVPGRATADGGEGGRDEPGSGEALSSELCTIVGDGEGDEVDATALAAGLAPLLAGEDSGLGEDGEAGGAGTAGVVLNALVGLLPSMLGETGSAGGVGSASDVLCLLSPSTPEGGVDDTTVPTDGEAEAPGAAATLTGPSGGDGLGPQAATAAGLAGVPAGLVGLLGTGSLDG